LGFKQPLFFTLGGSFLKTNLKGNYISIIAKRLYSDSGVKGINNNDSGLEPLLKDILVGVLLGDGWLEKPKVNARFRFEQSDERKDFFFHLYSFLANFCHSAPKLRNRLDKRTKKIYLTWHFSTKCDPLFTEIYNLFYVERKKVVPGNIIDLIGPAGLAHWIMCDGWRHNKGITLATNAFSIAENELLIEALNTKFELNCRLIKDHSYPSIHIPFTSLSKLQSLVVPYMHNSLLYKISL